ncbi:hypothetical protein PF005_g33635, partial [Phytophthora fragariae]
MTEDPAGGGGDRSRLVGVKGVWASIPGGVSPWCVCYAVEGCEEA